MGQGRSKDALDQHDRPPALVATISEGNFFSITERQLLLEIKDTFSPEITRLQSAKVAESASGPVSRNDHDSSPSQIIFERDYDEVNRTLVGILCLRWIYNDDYKRFTAAQPEQRRLTRKSFDWLKHYFHQNLQTPSDILQLVISMIINDLGKDPNLEREVAAYFLEKGQTLPEQNHDSLLFEAAGLDMIPSLSLLTHHQREDLLLGLQLGSELNAGQIAQAESVPINLEFLQDMRGRERAFELKFMEQILDVAGASGHIDPTCALNLAQPVFEAFQTVHDVSLKIIKENMPLRDAYDQVLRKRQRLLEATGFRRLSVSDNRDRALLRLLTMGRTVDKEQAELFAAAFESLDEVTRDALITGLNIDGNVNEQAVLPYYMPAVLADTLSKTKNCSEEERCRVLATLMRYLAKVFTLSPKVTFGGTYGAVAREGGGGVGASAAAEGSEGGRAPPSVPGIVIEHNMMKVREVINSPTFPGNMDELDDLDIPAGQQLVRRRTSHSLAGGGDGVGRGLARSGTGMSALEARDVRE